jgi:hypothetical protein
VIFGGGIAEVRRQEPTVTLGENSPVALVKVDQGRLLCH